jgi:hypothetical protein
METKSLNDHSTLYGDGNPKTKKDFQKLMSDFIDHHGLIAISWKTISEIEKQSHQWDRRMLKKAMKLNGAYKPSEDTIFILAIVDSTGGFLELFNKDHLQNWKAYAKSIQSE